MGWTFLRLLRTDIPETGVNAWLDILSALPAYAPNWRRTIQSAFLDTFSSANEYGKLLFPCAWRMTVSLLNMTQSPYHVILDCFRISV